MEVLSIMYMDPFPAENVADILVQCALQMKLPILRSAWVTECHAVWKQGDDVDLREVPQTPTMGGARAYTYSNFRASHPIDSPYSLSS